jgi:hypothetical protein
MGARTGAGAKVHLFGPGIFMQVVCGFGETLVLGLDCSIYKGRDIKSRSRFGASQSQDGATLGFEVRWAFLVSQILLGAREFMLPPTLAGIFRAALDAVASMSQLGAVSNRVQKIRIFEQVGHERDIPLWQTWVGAIPSWRF